MLTLSQPGAYTVKWIAVDIKGNQSAVKTQRLLVAADDADGTVGGTVPATLSLSLGTPAGVQRRSRRASTATTTPSTTANVISTAGDGVAVGRRPELDQHRPARQRRVLAAAAAAGLGDERAGTGAAFAPVGGSATPTSLLTYAGPTSNDRHGELPPDHRSHRGAPHRRLQQDADVHAVHDAAVGDVAPVRAVETLPRPGSGAVRPFLFR